MARGRETPCVLACPGLRGSCGRSGCVGHVHTPPGWTQQAGPSGWMSQGFKELLLPPDSLIRIRQDPQPTLCPCISCPQTFVSVSPSDAGGSSVAGPVGRWLAVCCSSCRQGARGRWSPHVGLFSQGERSGLSPSLNHGGEWPFPLAVDKGIL